MILAIIAGLALFCLGMGVGVCLCLPSETPALSGEYFHGISLGDSGSLNGKHAPSPSSLSHLHK